VGGSWLDVPSGGFVDQVADVGNHPGEQGQAILPERLKKLEEGSP
jgi:hypothetical protein